MRVQDVHQEDRYHASQRAAEWRRQTYARRVARRRRLRLVFLVPAAIGSVAIAMTITKDVLTPREQMICLLGAACWVPFLYTFSPLD